jgi:hypothetical protein
VQYGQLIMRALSISWSHRYLWLLAILGGADVGSGGGFSGNFNTSNGTTSGGTRSPFAGPSSQQVSQFLQDNLGLIVAVIVILLVLALAWFLLSCVTTGALVRASAEHDAQRPFGLGPAWRAGLGTFGSILGLRLIGLAFSLLVVAAIGLLALLGFLFYQGGQPAGVAVVAGVGFLVLLALIPAAILAGIVFILATRSVVLEQRGAVAALGRALRLLGARLGRTLLVWLIQVGLSIGAAIVIAIPLVVLLLAMGGLLLAIGLSAGLAAAIVIGIPFGLVLIAVLVVVGGMTGAYFSTYWTLAFRRMELDPPLPAYPAPAPGYPQPPAPSHPRPA